jgi:hypothetical protein
MGIKGLAKLLSDEAPDVSVNDESMQALAFCSFEFRDLCE